MSSGLIFIFSQMPITQLDSLALEHLAVADDILGAAEQRNQVVRAAARQRDDDESSRRRNFDGLRVCPELGLSDGESFRDCISATILRPA